MLKRDPFDLSKLLQCRWLNFEDVGGHLARPQLNIVSSAAPTITRPRQQVLDREFFAVLQTKLGQVQRHSSGLSVQVIETHNHQQRSSVSTPAFAVTKQLVIIRRMEMQPKIVLQRRLTVTNAVHSRNKTSEGVFRLNIPSL